jgi:hypothetical protein
MGAMARSNAQRVGLVLLLITCAPLIMAAGGGPASLVFGDVFSDLNHNGVRDPDEPGLPDWEIHLFSVNFDGSLEHRWTTTADDGGYFFILDVAGTYTVCEVLKPGWTQSAPLIEPGPSRMSLADCTGHTDGGTITPGPRGFTFTVESTPDGVRADFGNFQGSGALPVGSIRGIKFNDLNGNGVRDPGEPGIPDWRVQLVEDGAGFGPKTQPQPGPPVHATITVDRHTRRPPRGEQEDTCRSSLGAILPGCTTTTGGRVSIVLTLGPLRAQDTFNVDVPFLLGCIPTSDLHPKEVEIIGTTVTIYYLLSDYWMPPPDRLASLFAKVGVGIDPTAYVPAIKKVLKRDCVPDPNPANQARAGVTNPGILVVQAEIGFVSILNRIVIASTSTNASGEYEFQVRPGTYTVCETLPPGWRQTVPGAGSGSASCGTNADLGPRGYVVTLLHDPIAGVDFGNAAIFGLSALRDTQLWLGLKSSDDQGTLFDVKVELLKNGSPVASGLRRCVAGLTRNPTLAEDILVAWDAFNPVPVAATDELALKVSTRIGTNPNDTQCAPAGGSSHTSARGVRLYYDAASQPSHIDATLGPGSRRVLYLDSDGTACQPGGSESAHVTDRTLTDAMPSGAAAKCKDSNAITFSGGNPFKEVGTWTLR